MNISLSDLNLFVNHCKLNKIKLKRQDLSAALSFTKNYDEFKIVFQMFIDSGLKVNKKIYEDVIYYICDYEDCREILNSVIKDFKRIESRFFRQLIRLSTNKDDALKIIDEAKLYSVDLPDFWSNKFGVKEEVLETIAEAQKQSFDRLGNEFVKRVTSIKDEIHSFSLSELKVKSRRNTNDNRAYISKQKHYFRNEYVKQYALHVAEGHCQLCCEEAPFLSNSGIPFLEVHHIDYLSLGGSDAVENVIALCPNCHRKVHIIEDEKDFHILREKASRFAKI